MFGCFMLMVVEYGLVVQGWRRWLFVVFELNKQGYVYVGFVVKLMVNQNVLFCVFSCMVILLCIVLILFIEFNGVLGFVSIWILMKCICFIFVMWLVKLVQLCLDMNVCIICCMCWFRLFGVICSILCMVFYVLCVGIGSIVRLINVSMIEFRYGIQWCYLLLCRIRVSMKVSMIVRFIMLFSSQLCIFSYNSVECS